MRLIWTTENADLFRTFTQFLERKKLPIFYEEQVVRDWSSEEYGTKKFLLWILDEDDTSKAESYLENFLQDPTSTEFHAEEEGSRTRSTPISPVTHFVERKLHHSLAEKDVDLPIESSTTLKLCTFLVLLCSGIFLLQLYGEKNLEGIPTHAREMILTTAPVTRALLFDYPKSAELIDKIGLSYGYEALAKPQDLPSPAKFLYEQYLREPKWEGFYPYIVDWAKGEKGKTVVTLPPFEKIQEGEYWRLFSPALLHNDILHLFFNMIWLLLLGTQIELRIGGWKSLVFMLIVAAISNTAQYLMSGPHFLGFSGIICGQAFFIKVRQIRAPWEGYHMTSATFAFICFFIGTLALLSLASFIFDLYQKDFFQIAIANTAHLVGAFVGSILGRFHYFEERRT